MGAENQINAEWLKDQIQAEKDSIQVLSDYADTLRRIIQSRSCPDYMLQGYRNILACTLSTLRLLPTETWEVSPAQRGSA